MIQVSTKTHQTVTQSRLDRLGIKATLLEGEHGENALTPLETSGTHEIWKGRDADGQVYYVKDNVSITNFVPGAPQGINQAIKPAADWVQKKLVPGAGDLQNVNDIVGRRFAATALQKLAGEAPVVPAREVAFVDQHGDLHFATASPAVLHMGSLAEVDAPPLARPRTAAIGLVLTSLLMGNWDATFHEDNNSIIKADGGMFDQGEVVYADLGWSMGKGNTLLGHPYGSRELMHQLPAADLDHAVKVVGGLSNRQLHDWVNEAGEGSITGWNADLCQDLVTTLQHNRDELNRRLAKDPDWLHRTAAKAPRGKLEMVEQVVTMGPIAVQHFREIAHSGILSHITTGDDMVRMVMGDLQSQPATQK
ncbi:MAG TPA: hypothetical protein VGO93_28035 [Candidatus Xenobia bacterium]|jgi:hypothetical protein